MTRSKEQTPQDALGHATTEIASGDHSSDRPRSGALPATWRPAFDPDTVLGDRYRIVRFLARGGMGEVYEAEDLTLHMRVALKSIAAEVATDRTMLDRLKREVLLARKVTHPNVCRLHDLGFHASDRGTIAFLTMDLLRGDTLAAHVGRKGRLTPAEALPLVRQMADALDAAHQAGVIHRDFKSRNVMLVDESGEASAPASSRGRESPLRAVVMDFGIAVAAAEEERRAIDTGEGRFVGTPAYMAPEQVSGGALSPATDVYALGVVMFEIMTGSLPFESERALEVISMRLTQPAPAPRSRVPTLDRTWNDVILRCLARAPEERFVSAHAVVDALEAAPRRWTRARLGVIGGVVLLAVGGLVVAREMKAAKLSPAAGDMASAHAGAEAAKRRPTVAVFPIRNMAARADSQWLSTALSEMLATELSADEQLRVLPGDRVAQAKRELSIGDDPSFAKDTLERLSDNLGTDYVLSGGYVVVGEGPALRVDLTLQDAHTGATVSKVASTGDESKLFDIVATMGEALRKKLGLRDPSAAESAAARAMAPNNPEAVRLYAEGRARYDASDFSGAVEVLTRAVAADPSFPLAHERLASAEAAIGHDGRALEESKKAFDMSKMLSREEQLVVEARYRATAKEWDRAVEISRTLIGFFPDNVEYGVHYVHALIAAGRPTEAFPVLESLRALPPPERDDPRIDLYEAIASAHTSDRNRELAAGIAARTKAERTGATTVLADAHQHVAQALKDLGRPQEAVPEFEKALALYKRLEDRDYEARTLAGMADIYVSNGDPVRALPLLDRSLAISRELGSRYHMAGGVIDAARVRFLLDDLREARARFDEGRALYDAIHDRQGVSNILEGLSLVRLADGDLPGALANARDARAGLREVNDRSGVLEATSDLIEIGILGGDLAQAAVEHRGGAPLVHELGLPFYTGRWNLLEAQLAFEGGDPATGRRLGEEALAIFTTSQLGLYAMEARTFLARVALDEGRAADAEALARAASDAARDGGVKPEEGRALAVLSRALLAKGELDEATRVIDRASALSPSRLAVQIEVALGRAAVLASSTVRPDRASASQEARSVLATVRARAEKAGLVGYALEARLALAHLSRDKAQVAAVATDARAKGYVRIAQLAR